MAQIDKFNTQHVTNYVLYPEGLKYSAWMHAASQFPNESTQATAKRVLGRQNYCWDGSVRNWIWEREFQFVTEDGRVESCHWRLFASKRGFSLEVEDKYNRFDGKFIKQAAHYALNHFIEYWKENDSQYKHSAYTEYMELFPNR